MRVLHADQVLLPPALRTCERVMAGHAVHLAKFRPWPRMGPFCETNHAVTHLHGLSNTPGAHAEQRIGIFLHPVRRFHGRKRVQLERQVRMPGCNHLVIDLHAPVLSRSIAQVAR